MEWGFYWARNTEGIHFGRIRVTKSSDFKNNKSNQWYSLSGRMPKFDLVFVFNDIRTGSQSWLPVRFILPKVQCICKLWFCWCRKPLPIRWYSTACSCRRDSGEGRWRGCPLCSLAAARSAVPLPSHFPCQTALLPLSYNQDGGDQISISLYLLSYLIKMWYYGCNINSPEFYYISGGYGSAQLEAVY